MPEITDLEKDFRDWLSDTGFPWRNRNSFRRLFYRFAVWMRPVDIRENHEVEGRELDLYFEIPWNLPGFLLSERMRYSYGMVELEDGPGEYLSLDLNGIIFLAEGVTDEKISRIQEFNKSGTERGDYWNREAAVIYDLNTAELHRPGIEEKGIFESFLEERGVNLH